MKKIIKRSMAMLLVLVMMVGLIPVITLNAEALNFTDLESALEIAKTGDELISIFADFFIVECDWRMTGDVDFR